jgi:hypothetical protein
MPLFYRPDEHSLTGSYGFSYQELRDDYRRFVMMSDAEFLTHLLDILHFAVFVSFVKELQIHHVCQDTGIIHELVHLLMEERNKELGIEDFEVTTTSLEKIRDLFNRDCCLA